MKVVYIAGPFRGANHWEVECNIRRAETLALAVWRLGAAVICPHTNTRFFDGAADDKIWLEGDLELLSRCDAVLMTPDWQISTGAKAEHDFAVAKRIHVFYHTVAVEQWILDDACTTHLTMGVCNRGTPGCTRQHKITGEITP